jgi:hypothetical protein
MGGEDDVAAGAQYPGRYEQDFEQFVFEPRGDLGRALSVPVRGRVESHRWRGDDQVDLAA